MLRSYNQKVHSSQGEPRYRKIPASLFRYLLFSSFVPATVQNGSITFQACKSRSYPVQKLADARSHFFPLSRIVLPPRCLYNSHLIILQTFVRFVSTRHHGRCCWDERMKHHLFLQEAHSSIK